MSQDWVAQAQTELRRLDGNRHAELMKATILALVEARLTGASEETVWRRSDTCSRTIYHGKWKKQPLFAAVLAEVTTLAQTWRDGRALRALVEASERLALASPLAVGKLIEKLRSEDEGIVVKSAVAILDRAGMETATKGRMEQVIKTEPLLEDDEQALIAAALKEVASRK